MILFLKTQELPLSQNLPSSVRSPHGRSLLPFKKHSTSIISYFLLYFLLCPTIFFHWNRSLLTHPSSLPNFTKTTLYIILQQPWQPLLPIIDKLLRESLYTCCQFPYLPLAPQPFLLWLLLPSSSPYGQWISFKLHLSWCLSTFLTLKSVSMT